MANGWDVLNATYWKARNAVMCAMVEQRIEREDGGRVLMSLRDILLASKSDEQRGDAIAAFEKTIVQHTEVSNNAPTG